jgi:hypothetical protein
VHESHAPLAHACLHRVGADRVSHHHPQECRDQSHHPDYIPSTTLATYASFSCLMSDRAVRSNTLAGYRHTHFRLISAARDNRYQHPSFRRQRRRTGTRV